MKEDIRKIFYKLGADVCGFAAVDSFGGAPAGFHPRDIYSGCRSVAVFGLALPRGLYAASPRIAYTRFGDMVKLSLDMIAYDAALVIERYYGGVAVPVPADGPYDSWDAEKLEGRGLISMRHAAVLAGLGTLGKSSLLLNRKFGNSLGLGAVLTNLELQSDPPAQSVCPEGCRKCLDSCPAGALNGMGAVQKLCRANTYSENARGFEVTKCNTCRVVCPMRFGVS